MWYKKGCIGVISKFQHFCCRKLSYSLHGRSCQFSHMRMISSCWLKTKMSYRKLLTYRWQRSGWGWSARFRSIFLVVIIYRDERHLSSVVKPSSLWCCTESFAENTRSNATWTITHAEWLRSCYWGTFLLVCEQNSSHFTKRGFNLFCFISNQFKFLI